MKLNSASEHPVSGTLHLALKCGSRQGNVGVVLFKEGKWYSMPGVHPIEEGTTFMWIEIENCPNCRLRW